METSVISAEIERVVPQIWSMTLKDEEITVCADERTRNFSEGSSSRVSISGSWDGEVFLCASEDLVTHIAQRMFGLAPSYSPSPEQEEDAFREVTNMTAGNLKTVLPEPCSLGIPVVSTIRSESDQKAAFPCEVASISFESSRGSLQVTVSRAG